MPLTKVKHLIVCFQPRVSAIPARDFLHRINSSSVRKSNPDCIIGTAVRRGVQPHVWVEFQDKTTQTFDLTSMSGAQLVDKLRFVSRAGDTEALLQKAGLTNLKLGGLVSQDKGKFGIVNKTRIR